MPACWVIVNVATTGPFWTVFQPVAPGNTQTLWQQVLHWECHCGDNASMSSLMKNLGWLVMLARSSGPGAWHSDQVRVSWSEQPKKKIETISDNKTWQVWQGIQSIPNDCSSNMALSCFCTRLQASLVFELGGHISMLWLTEQFWFIRTWVESDAAKTPYKALKMKFSWLWVRTWMFCPVMYSWWACPNSHVPG